MDLEEQCVSLHLAKYMKELGFNQQSLWHWVYSALSDEWIIELNPYAAVLLETSCAAYTVAELGQVLKDYWGSFNVVNMSNKSEADARAKLSIWLKKEALI